MSATAAASWMKVAGPRLDCCSTSSMAETTDAGAAQYPTRQPVIAYVFERLFTRIVRARMSGDSAAGDRWRFPSYTIAS